MAITIINLTKSPLTFNLGAPEHMQKVALQRFDYDRKNGHRYTRRVKTSIGTTLDIGPRETKSNLPDAIENEVEIVNAKKAKKIRIIKIAEAEAPAPTEATSEEPTPATTEEPTSPPAEEKKPHTRRIAPSTRE